MMAVRKFFVFVAAAVVTTAFAAPSDAALVIDIRPDNTNAVPNSFGNFFDVYLTGSGEQITDFDLTLNLVGNPVVPQVTFSGLVTGLADYAFQGPAAFGPTVTSLSPDGTSISFIGGDAGGNPSTITAAGSLLGTVFFNVGAIDPAELDKVFQIQVDPATNFFDASTLTPFDATNEGAVAGTITVAAPAAVPEPSSMTLLGLCGLVGGGMAWRRRRAAAKGAAEAAV